MNVIKPTIPLAILFSSLFLFSCKKENQDIAQNHFASIENDTFVKVAPFNLKLSTLDPEYVNKKRNSIEKFYQANWGPAGMNGSFLVAKNGQIIYEKYEGQADFKNNSEITAHTPIHIASVSKVLTATAILKLIDAQKISLNQTVNSILPTFPYARITIRTLLNHRSGLPNYAYFTDDKKVWNQRKMMNNQDVLDLLSTYKFGLLSKPDTHFNYCNTNYVILALVIEKITGLNYREAMKKMIFDPLEMNDTFVYDFDRDGINTSQSYKGNKLRYDINYLDNIYGDKNIYATPRDLLKFDMATYAPEFLNPELVAAVFKGYSYERRGDRNYGLGIRMLEWDSGEKMFYHNGWWHGNTSSYVKLKQDTVTVISLSNKYTLKTYKVRNLAVIFGNYPLKLDKNEMEE
ncbi:serine hydrolase domain-containing protein [Flavobacterium sp. '19STA2R22 D10 B1']|uniref:serine hydrolase domain-containing protein n=1 Tax=Flavobacterium aerium TaxID=3037261 RepID=UPI00278C0209|nr:serine hydrolase domain-containing protein [Flavobacterium sp. '19STA2R22 D10 B1']